MSEYSTPNMQPFTIMNSHFQAGNEKKYINDMICFISLIFLTNRIIVIA